MGVPLHEAFPDSCPGLMASQDSKKSSAYIYEVIHHLEKNKKKQKKLSSIVCGGYKSAKSSANYDGLSNF